jgi:SpoVK/Ycf46/Vps4 family AAA+-type ATPase
MDGRGQVVVIGATNRPDSVDPALRRPGRFDREFYFPLPNREARKSIINIHTKEWEPPLEEHFKEKLAEVTKGYGGADLRALCTEAALNAIQRRYPQIYQTTERLELKPETIQVDARDFMMSVNKVVPSSARSSGSSAAPLKDHLKPLLEQAVVNATQALDRVMPKVSKRNPLEEAQWEDDAPTTADGGFGRELLLQSFEQLRVFRPRFVIHGVSGLGQRYIGAALLHHLEGFHVQSLDSATLLGDSGTTIEASIVQTFNEAKRHKPSVLYIPSLSQWADTVSESARATFKSLLDGIAPSDPILLVAICEEPFQQLPRDIRAWFGFTKENRIQLVAPDTHKRRTYFTELLDVAIKAPNDFPDGLPRRKRVLEELPVAPPRAPRMPTEAELQAQAADDERVLNDLKFRLGPVLGELKKKFPRFRKDVFAEYNLYDLSQQFDARREKNQLIVTLLYEPGSQLLQKLKEATEAEDRSFDNRLSPGAQANKAATPTVTEAAMLEEGSGQAQAQAQMQMPLDPMDEGDLNGGQADPGSLSGLAAAMTGEFSSENPPPMDTSVDGLKGFKRDENGFFVRDLRIWLVNLEKMQKRLYYNGYLTVTDFMEDIGKIVSNAKEAEEVDEERFFRAQNLQITANHLINLYIDLDFRGACERMAARMLQREKEAREESKRQREKPADEVRMPKGERHSSRLHGEAPTMATLSELAALERKRGRSSDGAKTPVLGSTTETGDSDGIRKKMRLEDVEMIQAVPETMPQWPAANGAEAMDTGSNLPNSSQQTVAGSEPSRAAPLPIPAYLNGVSSNLNGHSNAPPTHSALSPIVHAASTPPQPSTPHPPLFFDAAQVRHLEAKLIQSTDGFTVEQLEHLRAALFSLIWDRRSEWDKSELLGEMESVAVEIAAEVEAYNREERAADAEEAGVTFDRQTNV